MNNILYALTELILFQWNFWNKEKQSLTYIFLQFT